MSRYRPFHPARPSVPPTQYDDETAQRQRDRDHVNMVLSQGGFPVVEVRDGTAVWLWPMRARGCAA
jgi:hypothetical protein